MFGRFDLCFGIIAVFAAIVSLSLVRRFVRASRPTARLRRVGLQVVGAVTDNQMYSRTTSSRTRVPRGAAPVTTSISHVEYRPVVRFRTQAGEEITAVGKNPSRTSFATDAQVPLIYHPECPDNVMIEGGPDGRSTVGLIISMIVAVASIGLLIALAVGAGGSADPAATNCPDNVSSAACR